MAVVVVTVAADPSVAAVHDRMPAIVGLESARAWLAGTTEEAIKAVGRWAGGWDGRIQAPWMGHPVALCPSTNSIGIAGMTRQVILIGLAPCDETWVSEPRNWKASWWVRRTKMMCLAG